MIFHFSPLLVALAEIGEATACEYFTCIKSGLLYNTCLYYMANSESGQDESNSVL